MSLHRYFKSKNKDNEDMILSSTVIPVAVTIADLTSNEQNEVFNANTSGKNGSYRKYYEKLRCEVAKFTITASIKSAARKYGIPVNTVRGIITTTKKNEADLHYYRRRLMKRLWTWQVV